MKNEISKIFLSTLSVALVGLCTTQSSATPVAATTSSEVKTGEVDDDLRFTNAQGSGSGQFTSYGVLEFDTAGFAGTTSIPGLKFSLTQANAFFTTNGMIEFFLTEDTTTDIAEATSSLRSDENVVPSGIAAGDLAPLTSLGIVSFVETNSGDVDMHTFVPSAAVETYLLGRISSGDPIRFVYAGAEASVSATYAGVGGATPTPPTLQIVPEATTLVLCLTGFLGIVATRRR